MRPREIEKDPDGERFHWFNWRFSGLDRARNVDGRISYIPMNFGEAPEYYRRFVDPIDVMCLKTRPMDDQGFFNFGGATTYMKAASERARIVIVETCEQLLHIYGEQESLHNSQVDYVIDRGGGNGTGGGQPRSGGRQSSCSQRSKTARACRSESGDLPNAVCASLKESGIKDLGVHTEMFVDEMIERGIVTGAMGASCWRTIPLRPGAPWNVLWTYSWRSTRPVGSTRPAPRWDDQLHTDQFTSLSARLACIRR